MTEGEPDVVGFAQRVLFGDQLRDKLDPPRLREEPGAWLTAAPAAPGRAPALPLAVGRVPRAVPVVADLDGPGGEHARGHVLHAFADHELQALELFALALLRFPAADPRLRHGWWVALHDEQRHLALYLERMRTAGVELGAVPASGFFWRTLAPIDDPVRFTVGIGLVLEQANLDFSRRWRTAFHQVGDLDTAAVLDEVYEDEVRHVRIAAAALRRDQRADETLYEAFVRNLVPPLAPARARGEPLDREGRRRAGLDDAFVDALAVSGGGRGPLPRVFVLDPFVEEELAGAPVRPALRAAVAQDLAIVPIVAARPEDVVVAPVPSVAFLTELAQASLPVPQVVAEPDPRRWIGRPAEVWTWGTSPATAARLAALGVTHDPRTEVLYDKVWVAQQARAWLDGLDLPWDEADLGVPCDDAAAVDRAAAGREVVIKARFGAAGRNRVRTVGPPTGRERVWLDRQAWPVLVEPWQSVVAELSAHGEVRDGRVIVHGVSRFGAVDGAYRGAVLGPPDVGCDALLRAFLHDRGRRPDRVVRGLEALVERVGRAGAERGLRGPFGVDARVIRDGHGGLRLVPLGELNPRPTMGHLARGLRARLAGGSCGFWLFLPTAVVGDPVAFVERARAVNPVRTAGGRLVSGAVATNDPRSARAVLTLAWVGRRWGEAVAAWATMCAEGDPRLRTLTAWVDAR